MIFEFPEGTEMENSGKKGEKNNVCLYLQGCQKQPLDIYSVPYCFID